MGVFAVAVGAALGAATRHRLARTGIGWWATWTANVVGAFVLGVVVSVDPSRTVALAVGTGYCGALTTMSSLMLESVEMPRMGRLLPLVHLVPGIAAAALGAALGTWLT